MRDLGNAGMVVLSLCLLAVGSGAGTVYWDGGSAVNSSWTTKENWSDDAAVSSTNDYIVATNSPRVAESFSALFLGNSVTLAANGILDCKAGGEIRGAGLAGLGSLMFAGGEMRDTAVSGVQIFKATNGPNVYVTADATSTLNISSGATLRVDAVLAGSGVLKKTGSGATMFPFAVNPAFSGTVDVVEGTFSYADANSFVAASLLVQPAGILKLPAGNASNAFAVLRMQGGAILNTASTTINGPVDMQARSFFTGVGAYTLDGVVTGKCAMVMMAPAGTGVVIGPDFDGSGLFGAVEFDGCPKLNLNGHNATLGGLAASDRAVVVSTLSGTGPVTLTLQPSADVTNDFAGIVKDATGTARVGLTLTNAGVQKLSGTNSYTGATAVNGGTLVVNGLLSNSTATVTVNAGGGLGGLGAIDRPVTVHAGGILSPGDGAAMGALTIGNLDLSAGCTNLFDLGPADASDRVVVKGNLAWGGVIGVRPRPGFKAGLYPLFSCSGVRTTNGVPALIPVPGGNMRLETDNANVYLRVKGGGTVVKVR